MTGDQRTYTKQEQEPASEEITELAPGVLRTQLPVDLPGLLFFVVVYVFTHRRILYGSYVCRQHIKSVGKVCKHL